MSTSRIYQILGLNTDRRVATITAKVRAIDTVTDVHVEPATGDVVISSTRPLDLDEIATAVARAGLELRG